MKRFASDDSGKNYRLMVMTVYSRVDINIFKK